MANTHKMRTISSEVELTLKDKKNLLAFSAGVDSTALFFLLLQANINFDIAIVNYGLRQQSKEELEYAQELATKYNKQVHIYSASKIETNFEAQARKVRYDFFESLIAEFYYENLLTAHHLGDRLEWMLMQFCKGAGCAELSSMKEIQKRENYRLVRPLLHLEKAQLQKFLDAQEIRYFVDASNFDEDIKRNHFRHKYSEPLLKMHKQGILKSFEYLDLDAQELIQKTTVHQIKDFIYFKASTKRSDIYHIDKYFKSLGLMMSAKERELLQNNTTVVISRKYLVTWHLEYVFIAPYLSAPSSMTHIFKEKMRLLKIEPKLRAYFFANVDVLVSLEDSLALQ